MSSISARILDSLLQDWRSSAPAYTALADRIRLLILDGRIPVGARLPAERDLAQRLGVSRTTVTASYAELREACYLSSLRGSGSIARLPGRAPVPINEPGAGFLDFSKAALPASPLLADAAVRAAQALPAYLADTGFDPIGLPRLRQAVADRYAARGLPTEAEQVMITIGAQHAIALLARVLLDRGDSALVESPSYPHAYDALRVAGARLVPVAVTSDDGWDEDALEQGLRRTSPALAYLMPDFHNPTGRVMGAELRERMLGLAALQGTTVIADETMAELGIDEPETLLPLAGYGAAVSIGSLGKTVWGGVRIGWIRAEPQLIQKLVRARSAGDLGTPILEQLIAIELLGRYDEVLAGRREQLRLGRDYLEWAVREALPQWTVPHVSGGLTTWVNLGRPASSQLTLAARNEGLVLASGPRFGIDGAFERFLRLPFSYTPDETDRAVASLARAWDALSRHPLPEQNYLAAVV
ncbi:MAG: PLP-dependent aminotransferase family protein [Microbacteriaceae bacterium]|nr:PLP-dependent aminotransferase family protein [Microbacteriaceae bacterium]